MEGMKEIGRAYYERASQEERNEVNKFFKEIDVNGNGKVGLMEFKRFSNSWESCEILFRQIDSNGDGFLDSDEILALYYMIKNANIPRCDGCRNFIIGPFFSCLLCYEKGKDTYDLCCSCHRGGRSHQHSSNNMMDNNSLMIKLFRNRIIAAESSVNEQKISQQRILPEVKVQQNDEIQELREVAIAQFRASSPEVQAVAHQFFQSLDTNGDRVVDLNEFLAFTSREGYALMNNPSFFKDVLDKNDNGTLDFWEVLTLHYIIKSGRPFCDLCGKFISGLFLSCVECSKNSERTFDLCRACYCSSSWNHSHNNGRAQFLDYYTLLADGSNRRFTNNASQVLQHRQLRIV